MTFLSLYDLIGWIAQEGTIQKSKVAWVMPRTFCPSSIIALAYRGFNKAVDSLRQFVWVINPPGSRAVEVFSFI